MSNPRVIVALDYPSADQALEFVNGITPSQCKLKVGLELFSVGGPAFVHSLVDNSFDVFLDLKFHDIPTTVARACAAVARLRVWMLNVHTLGGAQMLRAAREAVDAASYTPLLVGVTVLTSHSQQELELIGLQGKLQDNVDTLAGLAHNAGLDGVVCSPREVAGLRGKFGENFVLVTPGIRAGKVEGDDQTRTLSPKEAMRAGADYLVIGRPVTQAPDPRAVLDRVNAELQSA
ncbi:MAG: orotidine-5'-phosphate decarboxylase [Acidiferrobacterales bacterium]